MTMVKQVFVGLCLILFGPIMTSVIAWVSYGGTRFIWTPFPARYSKESRYGTAGFLSIEHLKEGSCTVRDSNGTEHAIILQGEKNVTQYTIPDVKFLTFDIHVERLAMELICSTDVNLNCLNQEVSEEFADAYPIIPVASLSDRYTVPPVPNNAILEIVAAYDTTTVRVYFNSNCKYSKEGISYNNGQLLITILRKGQVLQLADVYPSYRKICNLGGTVVESNFPVALFSGSPALSYPQTFKDAVMSQIPPIGSSGTSFIIPKILNIGSYRVNIVANSNGTSVVRETQTGAKSIQLNETDFHVEDFSDSEFEIIYIKSSKPISVFLIAGNNGKHSIFSSVVPSAGDYGTEYLVSDIQTSQVNYVRYITLITSPNCTAEIGVNTIWTTSSTPSHVASISSFRAPSNMTVIRIPLTDVTLLNSTTNTLSVADNDVITLVCETNPTRPPSVITWMKDNQTLTQAVTSHNTDGQGLTVSTSVLTLSPSCSDRLSEVSCVASYNSTTLTSPVLKLLEQCTYVPLSDVNIINATTKPLPVDENDVISLVCETSPTRPPSMITWNRGSEVVTQTTTSHIADGHGNTVSSSVLTLTVACSHHLSEISCTASNNVSTLTSPGLKMFVQCPKALGHSGTRFIWAFFPTDTHDYDGAVDGYLFIEHNEEGNCTLSDSYGRSSSITLQGQKTVTQAYLNKYLLYIGTHIEKLGLELMLL
ncbi:uncharacterized protein LOC124276240 [Haliotis rubra]|uniref:uncharacterized protein LOC124276240 n=1 Tax=Haliotis rubra TaxID=36100 RepID=UPI001EE57EF2|nr:uncharacterized protein LOC124276240 [Haliotis rubra]